MQSVASDCAIACLKFRQNSRHITKYKVKDVLIIDIPNSRGVILDFFLSSRRQQLILVMSICYSCAYLRACVCAYLFSCKPHVYCRQIFLLLPNYGLGMGIIDIYTSYQSSRRCNASPCQEQFCDLLDRLNTTIPCCNGKKRIALKMSWH